MVLVPSVFCKQCARFPASIKTTTFLRVPSDLFATYEQWWPIEIVAF